MKLVTFEVSTPLGTVRRIGAVLPAGDQETSAELSGKSRIADLTSGYAAFLRESGEPRAYEAAEALLPPDMLTFLEGGRPAQERAQQVVDFLKESQAASGARGETLVFSRADVRLLAPLPRPRSIRDYSSYEEHGTWYWAKKGEGLRKPPAFYHAASAYKGNPEAVYGPEDPIVYPAFTDWLDLELELACVIGRPGRNIAVEDAADHIAGYTILIDASARDTGPMDLFMMMGPHKMKDFDTHLGPVLVTADEFDEGGARCGIRVNGETWFEGNTGHRRVHWSPELVAWASDGEDIVPGDVLGSGTIGLGCSLDLQKWVQPGDVVEQWIEGIGTISATVVREGNERSYVRHGLPGRLPVPEHAQGFLDEVKKDAQLRLEDGPKGLGPRVTP
ncbi:fumarylacetoacetate hydrolase family protein [Streptomyces sp. NPDC002643]